MKRVLIADIQRAVAARLDIPLAEMTARRRGTSAARARQVGMYLARKLTRHSFPEIGRRFGGRDHSTIQYGCKRVKQLAAKDRDMRRLIVTLSKELRA